MQNLTSLKQTSAGNITVKSGKSVSLGSNIVPTTSDGAALGTSSLMFSDLFLASGGVINFNNGDVVLTHAANALTLTGGSLTVGTGNNLTLTKGNFDVGAFHSTDQGSGVAMSSSNTAAARVYGDDAGVALTDGNLRVSLSRCLLTAAVTAGTFTLRGGMGHIKSVASIVTSGHIAGLEGYYENAATGVVGGRYTGVRGVADLPSGAVISANKVLSAFMGYSVDLGGTHTGKAAVLDVPAPGAGTWDALVNVDASTGCTTAGTTKSTPGDVGIWFNTIVDGTTYYVPGYASTTT